MSLFSDELWNNWMLCHCGTIKTGDGLKPQIKESQIPHMITGLEEIEWQGETTVW